MGVYICEIHPTLYIISVCFIVYSLYINLRKTHRNENTWKKKLLDQKCLKICIPFGPEIPYLKIYPKEIFWNGQGIVTRKMGYKLVHLKGPGTSLVVQRLRLCFQGRDASSSGSIKIPRAAWCGKKQQQKNPKT